MERESGSLDRFFRPHRFRQVCQAQKVERFTPNLSSCVVRLDD